MTVYCILLKIDDKTTTVSALSALGRLYASIFDNENALESYQQCLNFIEQLPPGQISEMEIAREKSNMGGVYLAVRQFELASECYQFHLSIAEQYEDTIEQAKALANLGSVFQAQFRFEEAVSHVGKALKLAKFAKDKPFEGRLCGQLSTIYLLVKVR